MSEQVTLTKEHVAIVGEFISLSARRNLISQFELPKAREVLDAIKLDENAEETSVDKELLVEAMQLLQVASERNPGFSRWETPFIQRVSALVAPQNEETKEEDEVKDNN